MTPKTMKTVLLFFLAFIFCQQFQSQTKCSDADSDILYAYSDVKDSYESNNIYHVKEYAYKSLKAFERAKPKLKSCGCETSYNLAFDAAELLAKVEGTETYEDGRFYVKRAREIAKQSLIELDKCTAKEQQETQEEKNEDIAIKDDNLALLQNEQVKLKQQQQELKAKEQELKIKLAKQKEKELTLKKRQLMASYKEVISSNIKSYNEALKVCGCDKEIINTNNEDVSTNSSIENIKAHYLNNLKTLSKTYLSFLETCDK